MDERKTRIRSFLSKTRMTRDELAEMCGVKKSMIDKWLSTVPIPRDKQLLIDAIIASCTQNASDDKSIHIRVSQERYRLIQIEAERRGLTTDEWLDAALNLHTSMPFKD